MAEINIQREVVDVLQGVINNVDRLFELIHDESGRSSRLETRIVDLEGRIYDLEHQIQDLERRLSDR